MRNFPCGALQGNYFYSVNSLKVSIVWMLHNQLYSQEFFQAIQTTICSTQFRPLPHHQCKWKIKCILNHITYLNQKLFGK